MEPKFKLPTETVELPSKGLLYPENSPLASGTIEMKYMTAKEEDILTNSNFITSGVVLDKLLQSLIVDKSINYNELLIGDKNALFIAARILSYGKDYTFFQNGEQIDVDLTTLKNKPIDESALTDRKNEFSIHLPNSGNDITFKLLNHNDEKLINEELKGVKKLNKNESKEVTTRLIHTITSINGSTDKKDIRDFVNNYLLAKDARALREEYQRISPDVDLTITHTNSLGVEEDTLVNINFQFFWPELGR